MIRPPRSWQASPPRDVRCPSLRRTWRPTTGYPRPDTPCDAPVARGATHEDNLTCKGCRCVKEDAAVDVKECITITITVATRNDGNFAVQGWQCEPCIATVDAKAVCSRGGSDVPR